MNRAGTIAAAAGLAALVTMQGCATIFGSSSQTVSFESEPPGATYQYGPFEGRTPASVAVARGEQPNFAVFKLAGYEEKTVPVETGIQGVTWLDILFWPGFIVDFATGNAYTIKTPVVRAMLEPISASRTSFVPLATAKTN